MLRIWKMPPWATSTRNIVLSLIFAVTVTVRTTSNSPSCGSARAALWTLTSICGASRSRKMSGAFGTSSDMSFK